MLVVRVYDSYANHKNIDEDIVQTVFGNLKIETVGDEKLLSELKTFLNAENLLDIKTHIEILKQTIDKINL